MATKHHHLLWNRQLRIELASANRQFVDASKFPN